MVCVEHSLGGHRKTMCENIVKKRPSSLAESWFFFVILFFVFVPAVLIPQLVAILPQSKKLRVL